MMILPLPQPDMDVLWVSMKAKAAFMKTNLAALVPLRDGCLVSSKIASATLEFKPKKNFMPL